MDKPDKIGVDGVWPRSSLERALSAGVADSAGCSISWPRRRRPLDACMDRASPGPPTTTAGAGARRACGRFSRSAQSTSARATSGVRSSLARGLVVLHRPDLRDPVPDLAGSLGGGGRYDNLIGMFSGESVPACGILARPRTHSRRDGRAQHVPGVAGRDAGRRDGRAVVRQPTDRCLAFATELRAGGAARRALSGAPTKTVGEAVQVCVARGHPICRGHWCRRDAKGKYGKHLVTRQNMKTRRPQKRQRTSARLDP